MPAAPPPESYPYDVFISYAHADREWVIQTLLQRTDGSRAACLHRRARLQGGRAEREGDGAGGAIQP